MSSVLLRPFKPSDKNFIISTWLKGLLYGCSFYAGVDKEAFYANAGLKTESTLNLNNCQVTVACLAEDEDVVLGYVVSSSQALHWVFVKKAWRSQGIGRSLLLGPFTHYTARTSAGDALAAKKGWIFNPWAS